MDVRITNHFLTGFQAHFTQSTKRKSGSINVENFLLIYYYSVKGYVSLSIENLSSSQKMGFVVFDVDGN